MQQLLIRKVGDKFVSTTNSLVIDMADSYVEFRSAGYRPEPLREIPRLDEEYIIQNHPGFASGIRRGDLEIRPIEATRWDAGQNGHFDEIDYTIDTVVRDPIYIFYETYPGRILDNLMPLLLTLLERTTLAASLVAGGTKRRRYTEGVREVARLTGESERAVLIRMEERRQKFKNKLFGRPTYWVENIYAK